MKRSRPKRRSSKKLPLLLDDSRITPRLAFHPFALEDEWYGRRRLRIISNSIDWAEKAPNAGIEILLCFHNACGDPSARSHRHYNQKEKIFHSRKHIALKPEEAARNLLALAKAATGFLSMLVERQPQLCRTIAATEPQWPVLADVTEKDWERAIAATVSKLELGR